MTATVRTAPPLLTTTDAALAEARRISGELAATSVDRDRTRSAPLAELATLAASGLLGIAVPAAHGGPELPRSTVVEVIRILARGDSSVAQLLLAHFVVQEGIRGLGAREPAAQIFAGILESGAHVGNATVERGTARSNERHTAVVRDPAGGWRLDGRKYYATGSLGARWIAVAAVDRAGGQPVTAFVRSDDDGVTLDLQDWSGFGQRATHSGAVLLENVHVPDELLIEEGPEVPPQERGPSIFGAYDQAIHAAIDVGIARAALEDGAEFLRTRSRPWFEAGVERAVDEPHVVRRAGELTARLYALEALLARATALIDAAAPAPDDDNTAAASLAVAAAKALAAEFGTEIAAGVLELAGTSATDERYGLDRHWRNVRTHSLHDPARWKLVHLGNHTLLGTNPPRLGSLI